MKPFGCQRNDQMNLRVSSGMRVERLGIPSAQPSGIVNTSGIVLEPSCMMCSQNEIKLPINVITACEILIAYVDQPFAANIGKPCQEGGWNTAMQVLIGANDK
jgi:hypothetical protein